MVLVACSVEEYLVDEGFTVEDDCVLTTTLFWGADLLLMLALVEVAAAVLDLLETAAEEDLTAEELETTRTLEAAAEDVLALDTAVADDALILLATAVDDAEDMEEAFAELSKDRQCQYSGYCSETLDNDSRGSVGREGTEEDISLSAIDGETPAGVVSRSIVIGVKGNIGRLVVGIQWTLAASRAGRRVSSAVDRVAGRCNLWRVDGRTSNIAVESGHV